MKDEIEAEMNEWYRRHPRIAALLLVVFLSAVGIWLAFVLGLEALASVVRTVLLVAGVVLLVAAGLAFGGDSRTAAKSSALYVASDSARRAIRAAEESRDDEHQDIAGVLLLATAGLALLGLGLLL